METLLRRSLGVSQSAKTVLGDVKAAPPVEEGPVRPAPETDAAADAEGGDMFGGGRDKPPAEWQDWSEMKKKMQSTEGEHDEL